MVSGQGSRVNLTFDGTGFLYHMVRILTGTLLEAGTYQRTPESVRDALDTKDRSRAGFLAPARGLFLRKCAMTERGGDRDKNSVLLCCGDGPESGNLRRGM